MKTNIRQLTTLLALTLMTGAESLFAQLNVPSDGSDGVLNITSNTVIDLSQAVTGTWSDDNTTNSGKGVYDPSKWAVVFKYQSVNIATNCTVTFANHSSHAPVVWLVQSNILIDGYLNLDGRYIVDAYPAKLFPTEPGPGGFRGGAFGPLGYGAGYGPGGGIAGEPSFGSAYGSGYGGPQAIPLLGGSGAGAVNNGDQYNAPPPYGDVAGSSGGGAILIAANGLISVNGRVTANDAGYYAWNWGAHASLSGGGAIRIIGNIVQGSGSVSAAVTRVEANSITSSLVLTPNTIAVPPGTTPQIWPPDAAPIVKVISINGQSSPDDPIAAVTTSSDINIGTNSPVDIIVQSQNFPPSGIVTVRVTPKYANYFNVNASFQSGTFSNATWKATTTLPNGFCVLQAHATSP